MDKKIKEIKNNSKYYSLYFRYYLEEIEKKKKKGEEKNILCKFFRKLQYFLEEAEIIFDANYIETLPQKTRIHFEFIQYLKFICCSIDSEEMFFKGLVYEFCHKVKTYGYFIKLAKNTERFCKTLDTVDYLNEKIARIESINRTYKKIIVNKNFEGSSLCKSLNFKKKQQRELNDKDLKRLNQLYWYSMCSEYKDMNELLLMLTFNYNQKDKSEIGKKNLKKEIEQLGEEIDIILNKKEQNIDCSKEEIKTNISEIKKKIGDKELIETKDLIEDINKLEDNINKFLNKKTQDKQKNSKMLISEMKDKIANKKLSEEVIDKIAYLNSQIEDAVFPNIIYEMTSYKIHACDILENEEVVFKNTTIYYSKLYSMEILDLIERFIYFLYPQDYIKMRKIFALWKANVDLRVKGSKHLEKYGVDLRKEEEKLKKSRKWWSAYKELCNKTFEDKI